MARFQWLDDETHIRQVVLEELSASRKALFAQVSSLECGCSLLRFLDQHANTLMTIDDIAYHLVEPYDKVACSLAQMIDMGLVRRVEAAGLVLYSVTEEPEKRRVIHGLCQWQDRWLARLAEIERVINGENTSLDVR
jgi:hypothetical protein